MVLILQIEDRNVPLFNSFMEENKKICETNGMDYIFMKKSGYHVPPYWAKVFEIYKLLEIYKDSSLDYIYWLDSDAVLVDFTMEKFMNFLDKYKTYSFIVSEDHDGVRIKPNINAGAFIVKNNDKSREIFRRWISLYHPDQWRFSNSFENQFSGGSSNEFGFSGIPENKWTTSTPWAGIEYEQGSFLEYFVKNPAYDNDVLVLPYYVLNEESCGDNNPETISAHLCSFRKDKKSYIDPCVKKMQYGNYYQYNNVIGLNIYMCFFFLFVIGVLLFALYIQSSNRSNGASTSDNSRI